MSILIKGIKMPEMRQAYAGLIICWDGEVFPFIPPQGYELGESVATAVPVPPHGRLIDADAAIANRNKEFNWAYYLADLPEYLSGCPTIIPAEEGE